MSNNTKSHKVLTGSFEQIYISQYLSELKCKMKIQNLQENNSRTASFMVLYFKNLNCVI